MSILADGFNTTIVFPQAGILFIEREVTPPGLDGGGPIDITAMRNVRWRTFAPKALITLTKMDVKARWDPMMYNTILANINRNQNITLRFPTTQNQGAPFAQAPLRTTAFYGWLNKFQPETLKEGEDPLSDMEFIPSNINAAGAEVPPVTG